MNTYPAKLVRVVDGDTVVLEVDLGFHVTMRETFRLHGVNCPEMRGESRPAGMAARGFTCSWFAKHADIIARTYKPKAQDKYGRWLADVFVESAELTLSDELIKAGHAVAVDYDA